MGHLVILTCDFPGMAFHLFSTVIFCIQERDSSCVDSLRQQGKMQLQSQSIQNHRAPTQSVGVANCYFIVNVPDSLFASPIVIYRYRCI